MFYILPILLAIKFRTERNFATMAGTIIGTITLLTHIINMITLAVFSQIGFVKHGGYLPHPLPLQGQGHDTFDDRLHIHNEVRLFRVCLVLISNIFFIEWANDDYAALRKRNRELTWCQLLRRTFCCCCKNKVL